jgi:hypothetical protein
MPAAGRPSGAEVVVHLTRPADFLGTHEAAAIERLARSVGDLTGWPYGGVRDGADGHHRRLYVVPDDVLLLETARELGIESVGDIYGGVVPHPLFRSKIIAHPLVDGAAVHPDAWPVEFPARVADVVLPGFSVFDGADAERAFHALRPQGPVRLKRPQAAAGRGQRVVADVGELRDALTEIGTEELRDVGLVLETNLDRVETRSVGQLTVAGLTASYHGTQRTTRDNADDSCYGGSDLVVVRGHWDDLEARTRDDDVRLAIRQARRYDEAVMAWPGVLASRRNYDVAQGVDALRANRSGVLEHSFRPGGASAAEMAAIAAFAADPRRTIVRASTFEVYGRETVAPAEAAILFQGIDPNLGPLLQYVLVHGDEA